MNIFILINNKEKIKMRLSEKQGLILKITQQHRIVSEVR